MGFLVFSCLSAGFLFILMTLRIQSTYGYSLLNVKEIQELTEGFSELSEDVLQIKEIEKLFEAQYNFTSMKEGDVDAMMDSLVADVSKRFQEAMLAIQSVQAKLSNYLTQPKPAISGPPRLVKSCCKTLDPPSLVYSQKLRQSVGNNSECCARSSATDSLGCNLRADEAIAAMKTNFETVSSILWQEIGMADGLYVQYPTARLTCDSSNHSVSVLLRESYRRRVIQPQLRLVIIVEASDEILNKVQPTGVIKHWDMVKKAAIDLPGSLLSSDRVTIVTTGKETKSAHGCNSSLLLNTEENLEKLKAHINSTNPGGEANYVEAFKLAFQLLSSQEDFDKVSGQATDEYMNAIILLTNAENTYLRYQDLFHEVGTAQSLLKQRAQIFVYAIQMLGAQENAKIFLKLADQNNLQLNVSYGTDNYKAESWISENYSHPVGPPGLFSSVPDNKTFGYSDDVLSFTKILKYNVTNQRTFVLELVTFEAKEGIRLSTLFTLRNVSAQLGLLSTSLSVDALLGGARAFRQQSLSYAYVIERGTGRVLSHPGLHLRTAETTRKVTLPSLDDVEPELTKDQKLSILSSDTAKKKFKANLKYGRDGQTDTVQTQSVLHQLVPQTNFIVVMVIFDSERNLSSPVTQQVQLATSAVYHRFDKLPTTPVCNNADLLSLKNNIGIKFSPDLFVGRSTYLYKGLDTQQIEILNNFIKLPTAVPNLIYSENFTNLANSLVSDLKAVTSEHLIEAWNMSQTTSAFRCVGTVSGLLSTSPATVLAEKIDTRKYRWFTDSLKFPDVTVVTEDIFPKGASIIISKSIKVLGKNVGVAAAVVPRPALRSLLYNKIPKCLNSSLVCKLVDSIGNIIDVSAPSSPAVHITSLYPALVTQLKKNVTWCKDLFYRQNRMNYVFDIPSSVSSFDLNSTTDECKKFSLHHIDQTNLYLLVKPANCTPEPSQCNQGLNHPVPGGSGLRQCSNCSNGTSNTPGCQVPCYCPTVSQNICSGDLETPTTIHDLCPDRPENPVPDDVKLPLIPITTVRCLKTCSETTTQMECELIVGCYWNSSMPFPTCIHLASTTTTSTTESTSTSTTESTSTSTTESTTTSTTESTTTSTTESTTTSITESTTTSTTESTTPPTTTSYPPTTKTTLTPTTESTTSSDLTSAKNSATATTLTIGLSPITPMHSANVQSMTSITLSSVSRNYTSNDSSTETEEHTYYNSRSSKDNTISYVVIVAGAISIAIVFAAVTYVISLKFRKVSPEMTDGFNSNGHKAHKSAVRMA